MTHPLASTFASSVRFSLDHGGQAVSVSLAGGEASDIKAVVEQGADLSSTGPEGLDPRLEYPLARWAAFRVAAADLPGRPSRGDVVSFEDLEWTVRQVHPWLHGAGFVLLASTDGRGGRD